jgi:hypothetical protein
VVWEDGGGNPASYPMSGAAGSAAKTFSLGADRSYNSARFRVPRLPRIAIL